MIVGPVGAPTADLILRAIGPTLGDMGVDGSLQDPTLELHDSQGTVVASDDNWQDDPTQAAAITATGLAPRDSVRKWHPVYCSDWSVYGYRRR